MAAMWSSIRLRPRAHRSQITFECFVQGTADAQLQSALPAPICNSLLRLLEMLVQYRFDHADIDAVADQLEALHTREVRRESIPSRESEQSKQLRGREESNGASV